MPFFKSSGKKTKVAPQPFPVSIVVNGEPIVSIRVLENTTLEDARKEILLESEEFSKLPNDYHFSENGAPISLRKENVYTVREITGNEKRLILLPNNKKDVKTTTKDNIVKKAKRTDGYR